MHRRLLTAASVVSLLFSVATGVLWIHSYSKPIYLRYRDESRSVQYGVWLRQGRVQLDRVTDGMLFRFVDTPYFHGDSHGNWDWGEYDLTRPTLWAEFDFTMEDAGFDDPSSTWGPFGWHTGNYAPEDKVLANITPSPAIRNSYFFPVWLALGAAAILPIAQAYAFVWQLRRRSRSGQCLTCGYNLTGNTSGMCPECGATRRVRGSTAIS